MSDAAPAWVRAHLRPDERVRWWARPSLVGIVPILASSVAAVSYLVASVLFDLEQPGLLTGAPALLLAAAGILVEFVRRFVKLRYTGYVVTDDRLYEITSFLTTNARSIPLSKATHVAVRQGLFGRLFGYWSARVSGYKSEAGAVELPAIRDGEGLLREASAGLRRGANVSWLLRGD